MKKEKEKKYYAIYYAHNSQLDVDKKIYTLNTDFQIVLVVEDMELEVFIGSKEQHEKIFKRLQNVYKWNNFVMELKEVEK